jgi:hypothetical protein
MEMLQLRNVIVANISIRIKFVIKYHDLAQL